MASTVWLHHVVYVQPANPTHGYITQLATTRDCKVTCGLDFKANTPSQLMPFSYWHHILSGGTLPDNSGPCGQFSCQRFNNYCDFHVRNFLPTALTSMHSRSHGKLVSVNETLFFLSCFCAVVVVFFFFAFFYFFCSLSFCFVSFCFASNTSHAARSNFNSTMFGFAI